MGILNRINRKIKQARKSARKKFAERQGILPELEQPKRNLSRKGKRRGCDGTMRW